MSANGWRGPGWRAYSAHPRHIRAIRDWIACAVASHGCPVEPSIAALAVSELFTNAILHGPPGGRALVCYCLWGGGVRIVVCDGGGTTIPQLRDPADGEEGGRGLHVVEACRRSRRLPGMPVSATRMRSPGHDRCGCALRGSTRR